MRPSQAPAIVPTKVAWGASVLNTIEGRSFVVLSMFTQLGDQHFYFDALGAKELSASLDHNADLIMAEQLDTPIVASAVQSWIDAHGKGQRCPACYDTPQSCPVPMC